MLGAFFNNQIYLMMETLTLKKEKNDLNLNKKNSCKIMNNKILINTIIPGFSYKNNKGQEIVPEKKALL